MKYIMIHVVVVVLGGLAYGVYKANADNQVKRDRCTDKVTTQQPGPVTVLYQYRLANNKMYQCVEGHAVLLGEVVP